MTSSKPYLLRAIYEWIVANGMTPHLLVDTRDERVVVPVRHIKDDSIVLNLAPTAVRNLDLGNEFISFGARFSGTAYDILVPVTSARMIYAKENGKGLVLPDDQASEGPEDKEPASTGKPAAKNRPGPSHLKVIK